MYQVVQTMWNMQKSYFNKAVYKVYLSKHEIKKLMEISFQTQTSQQ